MGEGGGREGGGGGEEGGQGGTTAAPPSKRARTSDAGALDALPAPPPPTAGPLFRIAWARVILDEAHTIRNPVTVGAKAAAALVARSRWAATGTPILNGADDLFGLWRFLRYAPYGRRQAFRALIADPLAAGSPAGLARLQAALGAVTLRRTKASAGLLLLDGGDGAGEGS